ncbi:zinc finger protein 280C isoform X2 [Gadus macrocephalus]|uniref:zinc finger protein 280C isoform X2 n=1 Tax=Gadus macrocephalus TaxID=80720 RepID=UPI0028CBA697|nr:zinc finger protein 280C isoform X2 [Gadus macrocephalus]
MSELFMECEEEELEPWQRPAPEVTLVEDDDDDDEPIFIGELVNSPKVVKPSPSPVRIVIPRQEAPPPAPRGATPIMLSASVPGNGVMTSPPPLPTVTPHPVIVNSQGYIVQPHQLGPANLLATLGKQYPPGTSFTIVPAGQPHLLPLLPQARIMPGVVHRPQVKLNNNVVTLSNVQNPAVYSSPAPQPPEIQPPKPPPVDICSVTAMSPTESKGDRSLLKRRLMPTQNEVKTKKVKLEPVQNNKAVDAQYVYKKKCYKCKVIFHHQEALKSHLKNCSGKPVEMVSPSPPPSTVAPVQVVNPKHILLVGEFYYGRVEGDWQMQRQEHKTNTTFKCQSCLKVLKNNIRFMNHMKHHLELEKQSSESWESYTTCQHCYRQYMTPYQLQCHVERAHSPLASSTNCKICELAFETEQVLLEHMKETHKPGEMPYVCQVCNFRSSFFMEVEAHFKVAHDNTKDLLCPFCLKVLRSGHSYMQHYMKHQRKGIHRCGKCRLNFLTYKERVDHKINFHKTFKKPKALEGLPPGTKVTIRASLGGTVSSCNPCPSGATPVAQPPKPAKSKPKPPQALGRAKTAQPKRQQEARVSKKNTALKNTKIGGGPHTCIECSTEVTDFFSHYPMISNCGACKYQTSCKVSISNHMIRYHSTISKDRFKKMGSQRMSNPTVKSLSCLSCDFLVGALEGDKMTKHLTDDSDHVCRVIERKVAAPAPGVMLSVLQPPRVFYLFTSTTETPKEADMKPATWSEGADPKPSAGSEGADLKPSAGSEGADLKPAAGSEGADLKPAAGSEGADLKPSAGSEGADLKPAAGSEGADMKPAAGSEGADLKPSAGSEGADLKPSAGSEGADLKPSTGSEGADDSGNGASGSPQEEESEELAGTDLGKEAGGKEAGGKEAGGKDAGGKDAGGKEVGGKEAGATGSKEAGGKEAGATGSKEAGAKEAGAKEAGAKEAGGKEAEEAETASWADTSAPSSGPSGEGSPGPDGCEGSPVGIDQVRKLVSSLQEDLMSSAQTSSPDQGTAAGL